MGIADLPHFVMKHVSGVRYAIESAVTMHIGESCMWHYEIGSDADFEGAPDSCLYVVRDLDGESVLFLDDMPDEWERVWACRKWISDEGWIDWVSGECPLGSTNVDVRLRSGRFIFLRSADSIGGNWQHDGGRRDIVAYRVCPKPDYSGMEDWDTPIPF